MEKAIDLCCVIALCLLDVARIRIGDMVARLAERCIEQGERRARIADDLQAVHLVGMEARDVDVQEFDLWVLIDPLRRRREVRITRADADDEVSFLRERVCRKAARLAEAAHVERMVPWNRALAGLRLAERDAVLLGKLAERLLRLRVLDAAAENHERALLACEELCRLFDGAVRRLRALDMMDALLEEIFGVIPSLPLDILRKRNADRSRLGGIREDAHRVDARRHKDLWARHAIPILADGAERIVRRDREARRLLHLLQDGIGLAVCVRVARQEEHGNAVCRRRAGCRDHVRRTGADRGGAGIHLLAALLLREADGRMRHALLVAPHAHDEVAGIFLERLADADDVAMTEYAEDAFKHRNFLAVKLDVLVVQELDERLRDRPSYRLCHVHFLLTHPHRAAHFLRFGCQISAAGSRSHVCSGRSVRVFFHGLPGRWRIIQLYHIA